VTLPDAAGESYRRLAGWQRVELQPGESKAVTVTLDSRTLEIFDEESNAWKMLPGTYRISVGPSSATTPLAGELQIH